MSDITGSWQIDPVHSEVGFAVSYNQIGTFRGSFDSFQGTLRVSNDQASLSGSAPATSVAVKDENLATHLLSPEFFDADRYPEIRLNADDLSIGADGTVSGEAKLELKGHSASLQLTGTISSPAADAFGRTRIGVELSGSVDRHQLGLDWNAPLPQGGQALGDQVQVSTSAQFVKEEA